MKTCGICQISPIRGPVFKLRMVILFLLLLQLVKLQPLIKKMFSCLAFRSRTVPTNGRERESNFPADQRKAGIYNTNRWAEKTSGGGDQGNQRSHLQTLTAFWFTVMMKFIIIIFLCRLRMPWLTVCSQPVTTVNSFVSSMRRSRRPKLSCSAICPKPTVRWLSGGTNMRLMPSSVQRSLRKQSK